MLILPGAALLAWRRQPLDALEWLAEAAGLSISLTALAALLFFLLGVQVTAPVAAALLSAAGLSTLLGLWSGRARLRLNGRGLLWAAAGLAALALLIFWRQYQARELALPAWVDGVHHVWILQEILAGGGLPERLQLNLSVPFSYHYGFHASAALFAAASGMPAADAALWFGQALNAWVALSVYRLTLAAWGERRTALLAAGLTVFAFHMPAYYVTWSRFTLLAGLVVLGPAAAALLEAGRVRDGQADFSPLGGLLQAARVAGLALTHYTALWLWGLFALLWGLLRLPADLRAPRDGRPGTFLARVWASPVLPTALAAGVGLLLASPWIERTLTALPSYAGLRVVPPGADQSSYWNYVKYLLGPGRNTVLLGLALAGLPVALAGRPGRALPLWGGLLALLTLPWGLRIGPFRPDHYAILLFFPGAALLAGLLAALAEALARAAAALLRRSGWASGLAAGLLAAAGLGLGAWGLLETRQIVNPGTVLATRADRAALEWIAARTPASARFFINTAYWQYGVYRGVDGGYWISTLTGRWTLLPPALYDHGPREEAQAISALGREAAALRGCDGRFYALIEREEITHLYLRDGAGPLQASALASCPRLREVYRRAGVHIYQVLPES